MHYDSAYFDQVTNRKGIFCGKWDGLGILYGNPALVPMWVADTDFRSPQGLIDALRARVENGTFGYGLYGFLYRDLVINWHRARNDIEYTKESIFYVNNVVLTVSLAARALTNEGENILVAVPSYAPLYATPAAARRNVIQFPLCKTGGRYHFDCAAFERAIEDNGVKLFILCNPHNPTGRVWTADELRSLFEICQRHNVIIVSDEIHSDLIQPGQTFTPAMRVARELGYDRLLVASSPTKTFNIAGLQVSYYICENEELAARMNREKEYTKTGDLLGALAFLALKEVYENGHGYVDAQNEYLAQNFAYLVERFAARAPKAAVTPLEATYLVWVDVSHLAAKGITNPQLRAEMANSGVAIEAGHEFAEDAPHIRINIACPRETLEKGVDCILNCLERLDA